MVEGGGICEGVRAVGMGLREGFWVGGLKMGVWSGGL